MNDIARQVGDLIVRYTPMMYSIIHKYTRCDYDEAQDAYQDICVKLLKYIPKSFKPEKGGLLFLYFRQRVIQEAINYRKRKILRRKELSVDVPECIIFSEEVELINELRDLANTPRRRHIMDMCVEEYTVTEIAKTLKMAKKTVLKELEYFRENLQKGF